MATRTVAQSGSSERRDEDGATDCARFPPGSGPPESRQRIKLRARFVFYLHLTLTVFSVLFGVFDEPQLSFLGRRLAEVAEVTLVLLACSMMLFFVFPVLYFIAMLTNPRQRLTIPFLALDIVLSALQGWVLMACLS